MERLQHEIVQHKKVNYRKGAQKQFIIVLKRIIDRPLTDCYTLVLYE